MLHRPEPRPRTPTGSLRIAGLLALDDAAHRLARRLIAARDEELATLEGVSSPRAIGLLGPADALPWVDGVVYLRRAEDPGLLLPTTEDLDVPAPPVLAALLRSHPELTPPLALLPLPRRRRALRRSTTAFADDPARVDGGHPMTPTLPKPLQPWTEALSIMRQEVIDGVGPWLAPLRALVGPLAIPRSTVSGDPDGLSGLTRRGSYERLVISEWAVALEVPDEFLRRALMGEHVFLARAYQEPHGAHSSVALLDVGPMQLGAPRLVQLAALVVLAQRAADCGAEFRFGMLQDEDCALHRVDRQALSSWAQTRSTSVAPDDLDGLDDWSDALASVEARDVWVVGAPSLRAQAGRLKAGLLSVEEPLEPGNRSLEVSVQRATAPGGRVTLERPDDDEGVRALRHPVRPVEMPAGLPFATAPRAGLGQLLLRGDRLVVRRGDGVLLAHHAPVGRGGHGDGEGGPPGLVVRPTRRPRHVHGTSGRADGHGRDAEHRRQRARLGSAGALGVGRRRPRTTSGAHGVLGPAPPSR